MYWRERASVRPMSATILALAGALAVSLPRLAAGQPPGCDPQRVAPDSYRLTTEAVALIATQESSDWWDAFQVENDTLPLRDLDSGVVWAAEHALAIDPANVMAHGHLARQFLVRGEEAARTDAEWAAALDGGGAVVWTSTWYDVDARSYFLMAFDRAGIRVYAFGQLVSPLKTKYAGPIFPGADNVRYWSAWGGCIDPLVVPQAIVPWSDVTEIKAANWVLYFKLARKIAVVSDRGKKKKLDEIKVFLHGPSGETVYETKYDADAPRHERRKVTAISYGPADYQERVRRTIVKFVDPAGRIKLPKASRGPGW